MPANQVVKKALLNRLGVTSQRLSQMTNARKRELPMSTEHAVYTFAFENGIDISKQLSKEETAEVRELVAILRSTKGSQPSPKPFGTKKAKTETRPVKVVIANVDVGTIPALKPGHAAEAKMMAEKVYPLVYFFENSVRDLIERVLSAKFGKDWWDHGVPPGPKKNAKRHLDAEKKDPWHGRRGRRPIDYVFLDDLWAIINHQWLLFKPLFPKKPDVEALITSDINVSRRVLAHMNPLEADDVKNIEAAFRKWVKLLKAAESKIP